MLKHVLKEFNHNIEYLVAQEEVAFFLDAGFSHRQDAFDNFLSEVAVVDQIQLVVDHQLMHLLGRRQIVGGRRDFGILAGNFQLKIKIRSGSVDI